MKKSTAIDLINEQINKIKSITYPNYYILEAEILNTKTMINNIFNSNKDFLKGIEMIHFKPRVYLATQNVKYNAFEKGKKNFLSILRSMLFEVENYFEDDSQDNYKNIHVDKTPHNNKIFIVHGHDNEMIQSVARFITHIGLKPIILREQPDKGRTIIEKFEDYSNVSFAIILIAPDDQLFKKEDKKYDNKYIEIYRTRQNVIFEMGFFIGKLGRKNVIALHKEAENFDMLSDYHGVIYKTYKTHNNWQLEIAKELKTSGFNVDLNSLA